MRHAAARRPPDAEEGVLEDLFATREATYDPSRNLPKEGRRRWTEPFIRAMVERLEATAPESSSG